MQELDQHIMAFDPILVRRLVLLLAQQQAAMSVPPC